MQPGDLDGLYTAPTDAALKYDLEALKSMGFNLLRKHIKTEPARFYYHCDQMGVLVWQDMPSRSVGGNGTQVPGFDPIGGEAGKAGFELVSSLTPQPAKALRAGKNWIAAHCATTQTKPTRWQNIDIGFSRNLP